VLVPLLLGMIWMGVYPRPVLAKMEPAARQYIESLRVAVPVPGQAAAGTAGAGAPR
jgi:NADH:ubiquinone oxidoreductase subunit 4 (subunit M)